MKGCILEANFKGQGWSRLFTILLILTWELRYPQKRGINRKRGGVLEIVLLGRGQMTNLGEGRICLWEARGRGKLYRLTIKRTSSKTVAKDFLYTLRVPSTDCFKPLDHSFVS